MQLYFAPLEGITGYVYRNAFAGIYAGIDKYFIPFLSPNKNRALNPKEIRDVLPEHNQGMYAVPQIMTNRAEQFLQAAKELEEKYGYGEVNLNLGCPSRTVVSKGRGAGFLARPEELDAFLEEVFAHVTLRVSVKTRIGMDKPEEFDRLLQIFNKYPLHELVIHPRVQKDYYGNTPNTEVFGKALQESKNPVCYNGDIFTLEDFERLTEKFPEIDKVMMGRGLLMDPALAERIKEDAGAGTGEADTGTKAAEGPDLKRLKAFHDRLYGDYLEVMSGEKNVLFKMKEFWSYAGELFPEEQKILKKIKKAGRLCDYEQAVRELL